MESSGESSPSKDGPIGFEYTVHVRAWETFRNLMRGHGISLREGGRQVTFLSEKRIDMKRMKEKGLLWSYVVAKVKRSIEIIETG
jgi:hypothetical protein